MFRPDDRVLVLTPGDEAEVTDWARALTEGALIVLAEGDELYRWRKAVATLDNVMVTSGTRDEIPWGDGYFTAVVDRSGLPPTAEIQRVMR